MGLSYQARAAAALAAAASFATLASAQGFYYEDLKPDCPSQYTQRYLGCFAATANPFPWTPVNQDLSATGDLSKSYIHWHTSTTWNTTITPNFCNEVCRAHGHKYASLWNGECSCGNSLDYTNQAGTPVTLSDKVALDSDCAGAAGCPGDRLEACGTSTHARIFVDPSYEDAAAENDLPDLASGYNYLGCFKDPNFPTSDNTITAPDGLFAGPGACFTYCADLGKPLVFMSSDPGGSGQVRCFCGQDFGVKAQEQIPPPDGSCSLSCSDTTITTCAGQSCCGTGNGPFPVYANPALMGCYVPRIPGRADPAVVTPAWDAYTCFETPASILNRAVASAAGYDGTTVSRAATFLATATAQATLNEWVLYGCYGQDYVNQALAAGYLTAPDAEWTPANPLTPGNCAAYCDAQAAGYDYAALARAGADQECYCATGLGDSGTGSSGPTMVEDCNQPCRGDDQQMCGNANGPIIYARPAFAAAGVYAQSSSSYAATPVYTCTPTSASTSSTASSTSSTASSSTSSTETQTISLSTVSQSATSTSSSGSASDTSSTTSSAGPSDTSSTSSTGPSDTATSSSTGTSDTVSSSSTGPSSTESTTSSTGPSDTASTSSTGPSDTATTSSASPSETESTSSTGPSDTISITLPSDTITLTIPTDTVSATSFSESVSTTGPSDTSSTTDTTGPSDTESVTSSSVAEESSSSPSDTATTTGPSDSVSVTDSSSTASVTSSLDFVNTTTGSSNTFSAGISSTQSSNFTFSATISTQSSGTASTTGPSSSGSSSIPSNSGNSTGPSGPSGTTSSSTSSSTDVPAPGATTIAGDIFLGIFRIGAGGGGGGFNLSANASAAAPPPPVRRLKRQDPGTGFVGGAGPDNPASCADATIFTLQDGALGAGGQLVSVDPGVPYAEFRVGDGAISTTFTVIGGFLYWYNAAFAGGVAGFCRVPSGQVYATFDGPADVPAGCEPAQLVVYGGSQCVDGGIIPVPPASVSAASSTRTSAATGPTAIPPATGVPSEDGIYALGASPTGQFCVTVTESWVPGEPTFIHDEL